MKFGFKRLFALLLCALLIGAMVGVAAAADYQDHFKGKKLTMLVPFSPGGGYDVYARMTQTYFNKYTGGTVVVSNMSGGAGLVGSNYVYNAKDSDLTFGVLGVGNLVFSLIGGAEGVGYEIEKFQFIGRISDDPTVLVASNKYQSMDDILKVEKPKIALTGVGEDDFFISVIALRSFGLGARDYEYITGWEGTAQWLAAVAAGTVDCGFISAGSAENFAKEGNGKILMQMANQRDPRLPNVPTIFEVLKERGITDAGLIGNMQTMVDLTMADRSFCAGPNMTKEDVAALVWAWEKVTKDPEFIAACKQSNRPVSYLPGAELQQRITNAMPQGYKLQPIFEEQLAITQ